MAEHISIEQGRMPWSPTGDAELLETLHFHDMPLVGVIRQGTSRYLFRCIEGHVDPSNVWAYTRLEDQELDVLRRATDDELDDALDRAGSSRPVVLALAHEGEGVTVSALVPDPSTYPTLLHAAAAVLRSAASEIDEKLAHCVA
jgi:hypothetical protein